MAEKIRKTVIDFVGSADKFPEFPKLENSEIQNLFRINYTSLLKTLKIEKLEHPETYEVAVRVAEAIRKDYIDSAGFEDLPPIPKD